VKHRTPPLSFGCPTEAVAFWVMLQFAGVRRRDRKQSPRYPAVIFFMHPVSTFANLLMMSRSKVSNTPWNLSGAEDSVKLSNVDLAERIVNHQG